MTLFDIMSDISNHSIVATLHRKNRVLISQLIKGSKEKFFIKPNFRRKYQMSSSGQKFFFRQKMQKTFAKHFLPKTFALKKTSDIFVENLV